MHRLWQIPELLVHIVSFLSAEDIDRTFHISRHFRALLKANLPPQLRPLPELRTPTSDQTLPPGVRDKAAAYVKHEAATPKQLKMEDAYFYWREDARCQVLDALSPSLHHVLDKYSTHLLDGYEPLAAGNINIVLQTDIPYHALYSLVHGKVTSDDAGFLAVVPPKSVTVFCTSGVQWDLLYRNVRYRDFEGVKRFSVKVEREGGVRMQDVVEELSGTLVKEGMAGGLGQDVVLLWVFGDDSVW